jgi:hypothetical protein
LLTDLGGESKGKEPQRVQGYIPLPNPQEKGLEISPRKSPRKGSEITKKENQVELKQALRNHAESSMHTMKVHIRSSFRPIILPSHKISP